MIFLHQILPLNSSQFLLDFFPQDVFSQLTELIEENKAKIQVLRSTDKWFGVTYREDKPLVVEAIARKTAEGQYPEKLWE